jgi:hypothetical protein
MGAGIGSAAIRAVRAATPIVLIVAAIACLWAVAPSRREPVELRIVPPPVPTAPKAREVTYEPWELVRA